MKILIGTDFSDHSMVALRYAVELSNILGAELHLVTAYQSITDIDTLTVVEKQAQKDIGDELQQIAAGITPLLDKASQLTIELLKGNTVDSIINYAKSMSIDLIVLGTQGNRSLSNVLFGSTSKDIIENTDVPVLAIPNVKYEDFSGRFLIALDNKQLDNESEFDIINKIASVADMKIDVLHVSKAKDRGFPVDPMALNYIGDQYGEFYSIINSNTVKGINKFLSGNKSYKCLVMVRRKKGIFSRLFEKGFTSREVLLARIPMLIIHE